MNTKEKINDIIFRLRQHNSEYMQDIADELENAFEEIKKEWKKDNKTFSLLKNKILKSLNTEEEETKSFRYCPTGNENYLKGIIQIILSNKITYLNNLKKEIYKI